jgi:hypothetical protein
MERRHEIRWIEKGTLLMMKMRILALLLVQALCVTVTRAQPPAEPEFSDEIAKQSDIYQSKGDAMPEGYVIGRSLLSYQFILSPDFKAALANLGPRDRWLDIGAGEGRAILDYRTSKYDVVMKGAGNGGGKAQAVAISIEDRRTDQWHQTAASLAGNQIQYHFGRRLREYSAVELGRFQVITDVLGAFSYTRYLSTFMEKALGFLEVNGSLHTLLQDVQSEKGTNKPHYPGSPYLTEIVNADGSNVGVCAWLKSISCVEVTCELKSAWTPPVEVYRVRKTCDAVQVPALSPVHFEAGTPPERRFQLQSVSAAR